MLSVTTAKPTYVPVVPAGFDLYTTQVADIARVVGAIKLRSATAYDRNWTPYVVHDVISTSVVSVRVAG